ncbi:TetR/AcrR family transcriptional regulator C-terminal domain-containing protein [Streptomyces himalayensis]|uniref:TetR/AcrR family transcriptional regulator C-terminal domain-containing protein n=1 Tax=Streptomyces himalayensis TaxID=2820085 RepID=UPI001C6945A3|nr:TetR/AcrR family transcriptional regulator C-terminal domain-containing protein [Streptomyces himalayensis]
MRLQRIINTESYRFPEIFTANFEQSSRPLIDFIAGLLDRAIAAGKIAPTNSEFAASAFMSMVVGCRVRAIVSGRMPTQKELDERVHSVVAYCRAKLATLLFTRELAASGAGRDRRPSHASRRGRQQLRLARGRGDAGTHGCG